MKSFIIPLLFFCITQSQALPTFTGKDLYSKYCSTCHGNNGARGRFGARNLQVSNLADSAIALQISKGKGIMPSFARRLAPADINQLVTYVKSLRP